MMLLAARAVSVTISSSSSAVVPKSWGSPPSCLKALISLRVMRIWSERYSSTLTSVSFCGDLRTRSCSITRSRKPCASGRREAEAGLGSIYPSRHHAAHAGDLGAQRVGIERLDDIVGDAGLLGGDDIFSLALRRDHDEGNVLELRIATHPAQQIESGHRRHVPVRDDEVRRGLLDQVEGGVAVGGLLDIAEFELAQEIAQDAQHGGVVVHDDDAHVFVE